jgi:hypothetical protein
MMSIYALVFAPNPDRGRYLLESLQLRPAQVGAYRDAWLETGPDGPRITVYTANGGPALYTTSGPEDRWSAWTAALVTHSLCSGYHVDSEPHAGTWYVSYYFALPADLRRKLDEAGSSPPPAVDTDGLWRDALAILEPDGLETTAEETP